MDFWGESNAEFARDLDGELKVSPNAASLVRTTMTVPGAVTNVESASGVTISDSGTGLPASATGVGATPACSGKQVVGADYEGNVFCLETTDGKRIWNSVP